MSKIKMKTKSSAKKRFKRLPSGKILRPQAGKRHGMVKRTNQQNMDLRGTAIMKKCDVPLLNVAMPYKSKKKN